MVDMLPAVSKTPYVLEGVYTAARLCWSSRSIKNTLHMEGINNFMVGDPGLEPGTSSLSVTRSNQLS